MWPHVHSTSNHASTGSPVTEVTPKGSDLGQVDLNDSLTGDVLGSTVCATLIFKHPKAHFLFFMSSGREWVCYYSRKGHRF
jgi:hypothetical protein